MRCPSCLICVEGGYPELRDHIFKMQEKPDSQYIKWASRYMPKSWTSNESPEELYRFIIAFCRSGVLQYRGSHSAVHLLVCRIRSFHHHYYWEGTIINTIFQKMIHV